MSKWITYIAVSCLVPVFQSTELLAERQYLHLSEEYSVEKAKANPSDFRPPYRLCLDELNKICFRVEGNFKNTDILELYKEEYAFNTAFSLAFILMSIKNIMDGFGFFSFVFLGLSGILYFADQSVGGTSVNSLLLETIRLNKDKHTSLIRQSIEQNEYEITIAVQRKETGSFLIDFSILKIDS